MVKTMPYFGVKKELAYNETLNSSVPEMTAHYLFSIVHNTNVAVNLTSDTKTIDLSAWKEASDFNLKIHSVPRENTMTFDDGVVTISGSQTKSGKVAFAGYTTAIVSLAKYIKVTLLAGKYGCVKRLILKPVSTHTYRCEVSFTDKAGVAQYVTHVVEAGEAPVFIDLRKYEINRAIALVMSVMVVSTVNAAAGTGPLAFNSSSVYSNTVDEWNSDPIEIGVDVNNSIDMQSPGAAMYLTDSQILGAKDYLRPFLIMIQNDCKTLGKTPEEWLTLLAKAVAYSISKGWTDSSVWNDLDEVRDLSKTLVGALTAILQGNLTDPLIPEHFSDQISELLRTDQGDIFERAAVWAVVDDTTLEVSN